MKKKFSDTFFSSLCEHYILWSFAVTVIYTLCCAVILFMMAGKLFYGDTDGYTRALRIIDWLKDFQWQEKLFPYSNFPDGDILHFTRINDLIWAILSLPLLYFYPLKEAVFYGGMFFNPLFLFGSVIVVCRGILPFLNGRNLQKSFAFAYILNWLFLCKITAVFDFNRPDHHSLMFFLFCLNISLLLQYLQHPKKWQLIAAGIAAAAGIWASSAVEGLLIVCVILLCLCYLRFYKNAPLSSALNYTAGLFAGIFFAFLINPPYGGYFVYDNTRLSLIHVILTGLLFISFFLLSRFHSRRVKRGLFALVLAASASLLILFACFGGNLIAPVYDTDTRELLIPYILEMKPAGFNEIALCLLTGFLAFRQLRHSREAFSCCLFTVSVFYLFPALLIMRFSYYELPPLLYLNFLFITGLFNRGEKKHLITVFCYFAGCIFFLASFHQKEPETADYPPLRGCVLTDIFDAPRLMFEKNVCSVGTPYHTNGAAIKDTYEILFSSDRNFSRNLLLKHKVRFIYFPKSSGFIEAWNKTAQRSDTPNIYNIITGKQPNLYPWLKKISTHDDKFYLYEVKLPQNQ